MSKNAQTFIQTQDELEAFAERSKGTPSLGIDTEFVRTHTYRPKLCLLQIATACECVAIDTLAIQNIEALFPLVYHPNTTLIFHACAQDVEILHDTFSAWPRRIYDTQVAEAFVSEHYQASYATLVKEYMQVELAKSATLTDWQKRPLTQVEIEYALDDIRYLLQIASSQMQKLKQLGRLAWAKDATSSLYEQIKQSFEPAHFYERVRHVHGLTKKQLGIVQALAEWREDVAAKKDRPRRWILSDELIVQFAKHPPKTHEQVKRIQGAKALSAKSVKGILSAIQRGTNNPIAELPLHNMQLNYSKDVLILAEALTKSIAHKHHIAPDILAPKSELKIHLATPQASPLNQGWKKQLIGDPLTELIQGKLSLAIENDSVVIKRDNHK